VAKLSADLLLFHRDNQSKVGTGSFLDLLYVGDRCILISLNIVKSMIISKSPGVYLQCFLESN